MGTLRDKLTSFKRDEEAEAGSILVLLGTAALWVGTVSSYYQIIANKLGADYDISPLDKLFALLGPLVLPIPTLLSWLILYYEGDNVKDYLLGRGWYGTRGR